MDEDDELCELRDEVDRLRREVHELGIDEVTGIVGRRVLDREMKRQFARARRFQRDVGVLMIDIDHFKKFNDDFGHAVGDQVLKRVAQTLAAEVRSSDTVGRYGGEEILVCVDETKDLTAFAERLRKLVEGISFQGIYPVHVSIGFAVSYPGDDTARDVVIRADAALYRAKNAGRNRVSS
jgi:diguanylate cyclase (GGDEF)-like protein